MDISITCSIKQNNFQSGIFNFLHKFRQDEHFLDVSLNCRDGIIHAHRIVLSLYSSHFYDKLKEHVDHRTPLSLENVPVHIMEVLLKFMYEGEVNLDICFIHDFLKFGRELKISGFPSNVDKSNNSSFSQESEEEMKNLSIVSSVDKGCILKDNIETRKDDAVESLIDQGIEAVENSDVEDNSTTTDAPSDACLPGEIPIFLRFGESLAPSSLPDSPCSPPSLPYTPKILRFQARSSNRA